MVTKAVVALFTMAESEESVPSVSAPSSNSFLAVSTPLESAASTSNVSGVSSRSEMLSKLCTLFYKIIASSLTITCHFDRRRNNRIHRTFSKKMVLLSCNSATQVESHR